MLLTTGRRLVCLSGLLAAIVGCGGTDTAPSSQAKAAGAAPRLPAPITLRGVAGVVPRMTSKQVEQRWLLPMQVITELGNPIPLSIGQYSLSQSAICAGSMRGAAHFLDDSLIELRFFEGATTDKGVGIGTSMRQLRRAYGQRLRPVNYSLYGGTRGFRVVARTPAPRIAIAFEMATNDGQPVEVHSIRFGHAADLDYFRSRDWYAVAVAC